MDGKALNSNGQLQIQDNRQREYHGERQRETTVYGGGSVIIAIATGTSTSVPVTIIRGQSTGYAVFSITGQTGANPVVIETTATTVYACAVAMRPGCDYNPTTASTRIYYSSLNTINIDCPVTVDNAYMSTVYAGNLYATRGDPYYWRQRFPAVLTSAGSLQMKKSVNTYFQFRSGSTSNAMTTTQMGNSYAAISDTHFITGATWRSGLISATSVNANVYLYNYPDDLMINISNNTPFNESIDFEIWLKNDVGNETMLATLDYGQVVFPWSSVSGYYLMPSSPGQFAGQEIGVLVGTGNVSRNYTVQIGLSDGGTLTINGQTGYDIEYDATLNYDIEIVNAYVEIST